LTQKACFQYKVVCFTCEPVPKDTARRERKIKKAMILGVRKQLSQLFALNFQTAFDWSERLSQLTVSHAFSDLVYDYLGSMGSA
jgi:hypothetical protein